MGKLALQVKSNATREHNRRLRCDSAPPLALTLLILKCAAAAMVITAVVWFVVDYALEWLFARSARRSAVREGGRTRHRRRCCKAPRRTLFGGPATRVA